MLRSRLAALAAAAPLLAVLAAAAEPLEGPGFVLSGSFGSGGTLGASSPSFRLDGTIAPAAPAGVATGSSGLRLEAGVLPVLLPPALPESDADGDGMPDAADNCVDVPNPDQADANASEDDDASLAGRAALRRRLRRRPRRRRRRGGG